MFFATADEVLVEDGLLVVVDERVTLLERVVDVLLAGVDEDAVLLATRRAPSMLTVADEGLSVEYLR